MKRNYSANDFDESELFRRSDLTDRISKNRFVSLKYHRGRKHATLRGADVCTKPNDHFFPFYLSSPFSFAFIHYSSFSLSCNFLSFPLCNTNYTDLSQVSACLPRSPTMQSDFTLCLSVPEAYLLFPAAS